MEEKCPICGGVGFIYSEDRRSMMMCRCTKRLVMAKRIRESGIVGGLRQYTFENFKTDEPWQQRMLEVAKDYVEHGIGAGYWMYFGGQPGSGKTFLATAIVCKLIQSMSVRCVAWPRLVMELKSVANNAEEYERRMEPILNTSVLFIDDFFKPQRNKNGTDASVTPADLRVAFDIINYRYAYEKPVIISSEWFLSELTDMDEAIASRIHERCGRYKAIIKRDPARNHRYKDETLI